MKKKHQFYFLINFFFPSHSSQFNEHVTLLLFFAFIILRCDPFRIDSHTEMACMKGKKERLKSDTYIHEYAIRCSNCETQSKYYFLFFFFEKVLVLSNF